MSCESCGKENPGDAFFCTSCGKKLRETDDLKSPEADVTFRGPVARRDAKEGKKRISVREVSPSVVYTHGFAIEGFDEERLSEWDASNFSRMSISLAAMGVRSPWRTVMVMLAIVGAFVAVGAGGMFLTMWLTMPEPVAVVSVPEPHDEAIFLGLVVLGLDDEDAVALSDDPTVEISSPNRSSRREPRRSSSKSRSERPGRTKRPNTEEPEPTSPPTLVKAPPEPTPTPRAPVETREPPPLSRGEPNWEASDVEETDRGGTEGGGASEEREETMDEYSARVRGFISVFYAAHAQRCFPQGARGTVVVRFTIAADGRVQNPSVARDTTGNPAIGDCLVRQVRQWQLSRPPGGRSMVFALTFAQ